MPFTQYDSPFFRARAGRAAAPRQTQCHLQAAKSFLSLPISNLSGIISITKTRLYLQYPSLLLWKLPLYPPNRSYKRLQTAAAARLLPPFLPAFQRT
ncbi:hypothetical protein HMPREF1250_0480 [Megasphaera vaginalis (ex Srinivasan et al. 2021)]|uniref:Uncharacterized protein n=1 Tax=Megasphaera vaginalis (ex Srinivasan et al. 2021) TaxID=1111454 RepID=U7UBC4_9FIRM|nr:hypothetical protein HMPREF1250_0480 [Megasphaera vaginalis (ex Srinivasan et al. 2021)]